VHDTLFNTAFHLQKCKVVGFPYTFRLLRGIKDATAANNANALGEYPRFPAVFNEMEFH
jgi:hypothetical protein